MTEPLLILSGATASYGASQALFGIDLDVREGECVALMGRNGMGKTTTVRTICRLLPHTGGDIRFADKDLKDMPSHKAARLGVGLVPEGRRCFANLSVHENLIAAAVPGYWTVERIGELFPRLTERRDQKARTLSGGEQQMLSIARALMTNPRLLILDEATEGLAPVVRREIWSAINRLKSSGLSILVIDKSLAELQTVADRCVILEKGCTVWSGAMQALDEDIADRYLGV